MYETFPLVILYLWVCIAYTYEYVLSFEGDVYFAVSLPCANILFFILKNSLTSFCGVTGKNKWNSLTVLLQNDSQNSACSMCWCAKVFRITIPKVVIITIKRWGISLIASLISLSPKMHWDMKQLTFPCCYVVDYVSTPTVMWIQWLHYYVLH